MAHCLRCNFISRDLCIISVFCRGVTRSRVFGVIKCNTGVMRCTSKYIQKYYIYTLFKLFMRNITSILGFFVKDWVCSFDELNEMAFWWNAIKWMNVSWLRWLELFPIVFGIPLNLFESVLLCRPTSNT